MIIFNYSINYELFAEAQVKEEETATMLLAGLIKDVALPETCSHHFHNCQHRQLSWRCSQFSVNRTSRVQCKHHEFALHITLTLPATSFSKL